MATDVTELLECPMCNFTVHPSDEYVLQLHFEQEHTTDSPFKVLEDDDLRPSSVAAPEDEDSEVTPSGDEEEREESTVACPEPDCGEVVLLTDFNEHLDYHNSETLSFDEITGTYHSQRSSVTMQSASDAHHPHASLLQGSSEAGSTSGYRRKHTKRRKTRKHDRRDRSNTNTSEKSTLARSIDSFNPFSNPGKRVKPPHKSARLGVSILIRLCV